MGWKHYFYCCEIVSANSPAQYDKIKTASESDKNNVNSAMLTLLKAFDTARANTKKDGTNIFNLNIRGRDIQTSFCPYFPLYEY